MNFSEPVWSYFLGLSQGDGHLQNGEGGKGKYQIELSKRDEDIILFLESLIKPHYNVSVRNRVRDTNFLQSYESVSLTVCSQDFRNKLVEAGLPYGSKADNISVPDLISERDYWRGMLDADGSLGFTKNGFPFVSLTIVSEDIYKSYNELLTTLTGKVKKTKRNSRDNIYNVMVNKEDAVKVVDFLYYTGCVAINRKRLMAIKISSWVRPADMKVAPRRLSWSSEHDNFILTHSIDESAEKLGRTVSSIKNRLFRLKRK